MAKPSYSNLVRVTSLCPYLPLDGDGYVLDMKPPLAQRPNDLYARSGQMCLAAYLVLELNVVRLVVVVDEVDEGLHRRDAVEVIAVLVVGDHVQHLTHRGRQLKRTHD